MKEKDLIKLVEKVRKEFRTNPINMIDVLKDCKDIRVLAFVNLCVLTDTKWIDDLKLK